MVTSWALFGGDVVVWDEVVDGLVFVYASVDLGDFRRLRLIWACCT